MFIKNLVNPLIMVLTIFTFLACETKAGNYIITAQVENGNAFNSVIKEARVWKLPISSAYVNGSFTITLPEKIDANLLENIYVGDKNVNRFEVSIGAYDSNGSKVGNFAQYDGSKVEHVYFDGGSEVSGEESEHSFWYVDKDVTIDVSDDGGTCVHLFLKKGWNNVYRTEYFPTGNFCTGTFKPDKANGALKWQFYINHSDAFKTRFAKGTLGTSGKSRPIEMFFEKVYKTGNIYFIYGKSKTNAAADAFEGSLKISGQTVGGSCKSDEFEIKGSYDLDEKESKTSGSFKGTFTACEKNGKLSKASFKGNWIKHANGNKTPCEFGL
jgi:hypothetical protein